MIAALVSITTRALLARRRTLLLGLLGVLLVLISVVYRLANPGDGAAADEVTRGLLGNFGIRVLLPIVAVIVGTAALGSELDDGTIVYLLSKPVPRWQIVLVKLLGAWLVTSLLVAPAIVVAGIIGNGDVQLAVGYGLAAVVGGLEYSAIFVALSLVTSRALIIGLAYVVVWEGVIASLFAGTLVVSVRQHALAIAEAFGGSAAADATELEPGIAVVALTVATLAATVLAVRRLETVELRGETG